MNGRVIETFVALGDSFTAGLDEDPPGTIWADLVASRLRASNPAMRYRNLAVNGATSADVTEQTDAALGIEPDLVTVVCGMNDVLKSVRLDPDGFAASLAAIFDRLQAKLPGAAILTATAPGNLVFPRPLRPLTKAHIVNGLRTLNRTIMLNAGERDIPAMRWSEHPGLRDPANFAADGLHPSTRGHTLMADEVSAALRRHFEIEIEPARGSVSLP
jgi:lysophospholipase L1-like esterase